MHKALEKFFFVFGDARSGNTFLSYQIMAHMNALIPPESSFIANITNHYKAYTVTTAEDVDSFVDILFSDEKFVDWGLTKEQIKRRLSQKHLSKNEALLEIMSLYCEQHNDKAVSFGIQKNYIQLYPKLRRMLPDSKIIHIVRDGRAVFNSQKKNIVSDGSGYFQTNARKAALSWVYKNKKLQSYSSKYKNVLLVRYEDLVLDLSGTLKRIASFLDLEYSDRPLAEMYVPERYSGIHQNVGHEAKPSRLDAWKDDLEAEDVRLYEKIAGTYLDDLGYLSVTKETGSKLYVFVCTVLNDIRFFVGRILKRL